MTQEEVAANVQFILIQYCNVQPGQFVWDKPLEALQEDFKFLRHLVFLEQLLSEKFGKKIPLLENISTSFHTPKDIIQLIMNGL